MKRLVVIVGLIIIFSGLFLIASSRFQHQTNRKDEIRSAEDTWSISGYLKEGENLTLNFSPHPDWSYLYYLEPIDGAFYIKHFMVNITNIATNNYTLFRVVLMPPLQHQPPREPYSFLLYISEIEVIQHGALIAEDQPKNIGGIAKSNGNHSVKCWLNPEYVIDRDWEGNLWPHPASPPRTLILSRVITEVTYPYNFLLHVGASTIAVGFVTSIWGARSKRRKILRKRTSR